MSYAIIILTAAGVISLVTLFFFWTRSQTRTLGTHFQTMRDGFDGFQRNLLMHQNEFERTQDSRLGTLRTELSTELQNNRRELQQGLMQSSLAVETRVTTLDQRLEARLKEMSEGVQARLETNVKEGFRHFEKVSESLKAAEQQLTQLNFVGQSIHDLNNLLKLPHLRGGFGESTLERILSDMLPADAFELQYRITPNSTERVDAVIKYPTYVLPVDSKFPREQVLPLFETNDPEQLEGARKNLVDVMRSLARSIKEKYIKPEHGTTDMALLFVPSETLYFEILRNPKLCEELTKHKVFAVSPNTFAVTLHAVGMARGYYEMSRGVEKTILEIRKTKQHFENFEKKFEEVGSSLTRAQTAYGTATTHLSRYGSAVSRLTGQEALPPTEVAVEGRAGELLPP